MLPRRFRFQPSPLLNLLKLLKVVVLDRPWREQRKGQSAGKGSSSSPHDAPGLAAANAGYHCALGEAHEPAVVLKDSHNFTRGFGFADRAGAKLVEGRQRYCWLAPLLQ